MANERARQLRRTMSEAERRLWRCLRSRQIDGHRFRRQHPIGPYTVDFICLARCLVVEIDGSHHGAAQQAEHDAERTAWLATEGYRVVRFPTTEVHTNLDGVLAAIQMELARGTVPGAATPT